MSRPLRVMIDARMLIGRFAGISRVVTRLVDELAEQDGLQVVALCGDEVYPLWENRGEIDVVTTTFGRRDRTAAWRVLWEETRLPGYIRRADVDLFHAAWNTGIPASCPVPSVLTVHDLIPWRDPEAHFATALQRASYRYALRSSIRRAARITTVSDYVRRELIATFRLNPQRVITVPNGVDLPSGERLDQSRPAAAPYVLYVGGHEARKNVEGVFAAMRTYWERYDTGLELRLTGDAGSLSPAAAGAYRQLPERDRVRFLGHINDSELKEQYAGAQALLMLSREEGFGLPALEAMAHGCPVIAADATSLPEVVSDAGILVDPNDAPAAAAAIRRLVTSQDTRAKLVQRGMQRVRAFGWDAVGARMRRLYESLDAEEGRTNAEW